MACYYPTPARQDRPGEQPKLNPPKGTENLAVPCGTCIGCRADHATEWGHRAGHEASLWPANTFLNLTYDDKHLPPDGHLDAAALTRFIKRLRQHATRHSRSIAGDRSRGIRYFACGEYGETTGRPHYHLALFNAGFPDGERVGGPPEAPLFESGVIGELWTDGGHRYGPADAGAAGNYIAKYILKKQLRNGLRMLPNGTWIDHDGVEHPRPPFLRMSTRPAIGNEWLRRYAGDLRKGYMVTNQGAKAPIPRTYMRRLEIEQPQLHDEIKARKLEHLDERYDPFRLDPNNPAHPDRLRDAERIRLSRKETRKL